MSARWRREVNTLEELLLTLNPTHPWIPLIVVALRVEESYRMLGRHGDKMHFDVVIPSQKVMDKVAERLDLSLFTEEAAADPSTAVHKLLLLCVGRLAADKDGFWYRSVVKDESYDYIKFPAPWTSRDTSQGHDIDSIKTFRFQRTSLDNVHVSLTEINGVLNRMRLLSQVM
jgi:hypothetical protein